MARGFDNDLFYRITVQQMTAESYLEEIVGSRQETLRERLLLGNNASRTNGYAKEQTPEQDILPGATRLTKTQIEAFLTRYEILDHHANDATGFSATLIRDKLTNQLHLAFRSTEFATEANGGDRTRDIGGGLIGQSPPGADSELLREGFALAQIAAMEAYFAAVRRDSKFKFAEAAGYTVSGYSLGGHLATVFAENHADDPAFLKAYIFNGAGRGGLVGPVADNRDLLGLYLQIMGSPQAGYEAVQARLRGAGMGQTAASLALSVATSGLLRRALGESAYDFVTDGAYYAASVYSTARHQLAMRLLDPFMDSALWVSILGGNPLAPAVAAKIEYLFGTATHDDDTLVANSGITVPADARQWLFIEDQPDFYGEGGVFNLAGGALAMFSGDFLRTHSITLLADSLALMNAFSRADPSLTKLQIETFFAASSNRRAAGSKLATRASGEGDSLENALYALDKALAADPALVKKVGVDRGPDGFGNITLREQFYQRLAAIDARLNQWAAPASGGSGLSIVPLAGMAWVARSNLRSIATGLGPLTVSAAAPDAAALVAKAGEAGPEGLAYRYALRELNPFVVLGLDYTAHNRAGALDLATATSGANGLSAQYLADRATMLAWRLKQGIENSVASTSTDGGRWLLRDIPGAINVVLLDAAAKVEAVANNGPADSLEKEAGLLDLLANAPGWAARVVAFGGDAPDAVAGGALDDRLYAGAGADYLEGRAGNDYLEGGSGRDIYQYRAGRNLLGFESADGDDTIRDTDGRGVIRRSYSDGRADALLSGRGSASLIVGGAFVKEAGVAGGWRSLDGTITLTRLSGQGEGAAAGASENLRLTFSAADGTPRPGSITLQGWRQGDFGIRLVETSPAAAPGVAREILGDRRFEDVDPATPEPDRRRDDLGNWLRTSVVEAGQDDVLFGGRPAQGAPDDPRAPGDHIVSGAGNDTIYADRPGPQGDPLADDGRGDADWVEAGAGRDRIEAGAGDDLVEAGEDGIAQARQGGDVVAAGPGDDRVFGGARVDLAQAIVDADRAQFPDNPRPAVAATGLRGDFLAGGPGDDTLVGGAGNDAITTGAGRDLVVAGAGDDTIVSADYAARGFDWDLAPENTGFVPGTMQGQVFMRDRPTRRVFVNASGEEEPQPQADAPGKTVYAGAGADWISMGCGDDFVDAGSGDDLAGGGAGDDILLGQAGRDALLGNTGDDVLDGGADDDFLYGAEGEDVLLGGTGRDVLEGGAGADILVGEAGDDVLAGGPGRDTYVFDRGDGVDVIDDPDDRNPDSSADKSEIVLGPGVLRSDLRFGRGSLLLDFGGGDALHLMLPAGQDDPSLAASFGRIRFADGSSMDFADMLAQGFDIVGTERVPATFDAAGNAIPGQSGNDVLVGTAAASDRLRGLSGDDVLSGLGGDDTLDGGPGDDRLSGGAGDDAYVFAVGHGNDSIGDSEGVNTLSFGAGIAAAGVGVQSLRYYSYAQGRYVDALRLITPGPGGTSGSIEIAGGLAQGRTRYVFADGTVLAQEDLLARTTAPLWIEGGAGDDRLAGGGGADGIYAGAGADTLIGGAGDDVLYGQAGGDTLGGDAGNDRLYGGDGDDVLAGGAGNDSIDGEAGADELSGGAGADVLRGGAGDDRYRFDIGAGIDLIEDGEGANLLQFGAGIASAQVQARLINDAAGAQYVQFDVGGGDSVLVRAAFGTTPAAATLDFAFADGTRLDLRSLLATALAAPLDYVAGNSAIDLTGSRFGDRIAGSLADDRIDGADGDDRLYGDEGADRLLGGEGSDLLLGGGGDDLLEGGAGADTYELRRGMGRDIVVDGGAEGNILALDAGLELADLSIERSGSDLVLRIGTGEDSLILRNQLAGNAPWQLRLAGGSAVSLQDFLAAAPPPATATVADAMDAFARRLEESFVTMLVLGGYARQADGTYVRDVSDGGLYNTRHEVDRVSFASVREQAAQPVHVQAAPAVRVLAMQSSSKSVQRTVTVSDTSQAVYVGFPGGGNVAGPPGPTGRFVTDFPYVSLTGGTVSLSSGLAEPVFGPSVQARSGPPAPGQSLGGAQRTVIGFFVYDRVARQSPGGAAGGAGGASGGAVFQPRTVVQTVQAWHTEVAIDYAVSIVRIDGNAADNVVTVAGSAIVDAGDGNDVVRVRSLSEMPAHAVVPSGGRPGALLYGGAGDDTLLGGGDNDVLVAGAGVDLLRGDAGNDRYLIIPGAGTATVDELMPNAPVSGLVDVAAVLAGSPSRDVVELPAGVRLADLRLAWSDEPVQMPRYSNARNGTYYLPDLPLKVMTAVLTVSWGGPGGTAVRIPMPHSDDPFGAGVEFLRLGDGTLLTRADLLALAPHDLDPHLAGSVIRGRDIDAEAGDDVLEGEGILRGGAGDDTVTGGAGRDAITGDEGADSLAGGAGDDLLGFGVREFSGAGNVYRGGAGHDVLLGSQAADVFLFERGDGADVIGDFWHSTTVSPLEEGWLPDLQEGLNQGINWGTTYADAYYYEGQIPARYAGYDTLRLGAGIRPEEIGFVRAAAQAHRGSAWAYSGQARFDPAAVVQDAYGPDLVIRVGTAGDSVRIAEFFRRDDFGLNGYIWGGSFDAFAERNPLGRIEFADGTVWDRAALDARLDVFGNRAPALVLVPPVARATVGTPFSFALAAGTIVDPNPGDRLEYSLLAPGTTPWAGPVAATLPGWLAFDAATGRFQGAPQVGDVGRYQVSLRATDPAGLFTEALLVFEVSAAPAPAAPVATPDPGNAPAGTGAAVAGGGAAPGAGAVAGGADGGTQTGGGAAGAGPSVGPATPDAVADRPSPAPVMADAGSALPQQGVRAATATAEAAAVVDLPAVAVPGVPGMRDPAPGGVGYLSAGTAAATVPVRGTRTGLNMDAIGAAVEAFEAQAPGGVREGPAPAGGGEAAPDAERPEAGLSRQAVLAALARFRLEAADAAGAAWPVAAPFGLAGLAGGNGVGLGAPGMVAGEGAVLAPFSGLAEGFARL